MLSSFDFSSNTTAGCANQHFFIPSEGVRTGRAFFKIKCGGEYNYSLLFSGTLDGSYRRLSFPNEPCSDWEIHRARVGRLASLPDDISPEDITDDEALTPEWLSELTFSGSPNRKAEDGFFASDPVRLSFSEGELLCLELEYSGGKIPCHPEVTIPVYNKRDTEGNVLWEYTVNMPLPTMIGCDRPIKERVAYLGDSITQGADTPTNSYSHWVARFAEKLPDCYAHWNIGIGYGKAADAASFGAWYQKALTADTVFLCYGVNDVNSDYTAEHIKGDLFKIVSDLKSRGKRVILQTVPPFNYPEPRRLVWEEVNRYIKEELSALADRVFDPNFILSLSKEEPHLARYGGHPDPEGCALWANALYEAVKDMFPA
ncbi:MAG: SGNH/GDSL hydrolase family protein [Clostridia bacterium]|nr:SGNH/GDSL hydrolase family protein [Clostridia bacterium]